MGIPRADTTAMARSAIAASIAAGTVSTHKTFTRFPVRLPACLILLRRSARRDAVPVPAS